ncbi:MAG: hypothetical protein QOG53_2797 [Frankiales bacterium]|nr:hypothetical protein [Frankiales bacterium]
MTEPDEQEQTPEEPAAAATQPAMVPRPEPPPTDEPAVDAAIKRLHALDELPVAEHVGIFDEAHRELQDSLADLDEE